MPVVEGSRVEIEGTRERRRPVLIPQEAESGSIAGGIAKGWMQQIKAVVDEADGDACSGAAIIARHSECCQYRLVETAGRAFVAPYLFDCQLHDDP